MSLSSPEVEQIAAWIGDPVKFVRDNFKVEPDAWQKKSLRKLVSTGDGFKMFMALRACAGPGKSAVMAWAIWWFMALMADEVDGLPDFPNAYCMSITRDNLRDNLWKELHRWHDVSEFIKSQFDMNSDRAYHVDHPDTWFISARSFSQSATAEEMGEALSGLHANRCAVFLDESGGMPAEILKRAKQAMTTAKKYGLIMQAGNPSSREGCLFEAENDKTWTKIRITGDPEDPDRSPRIDLQGAKDAIDKYGRDDAWVRVYILGEFPLASLTGLLSEVQVRAALDKQIHPSQWTWSDKRIGIDVARFGDDRTVFFPRQGRVAFPCKVLRKQDGPTIARLARASKERFGAEMLTIDDTGGWAGSVLDFAKIDGLDIIPVNKSEQADDPDRFVNKRAECYWRAAEWVKAGGALPPDPDLVKEATAAQYTITRNRIQIESKDQIKKRIRVSPDKWDAFCLTFARAEAVGASVSRGTEGNVIKATADLSWMPPTPEEAQAEMLRGGPPGGPQMGQQMGQQNALDNGSASWEQSGVSNAARI